MSDEELAVELRKIGEANNATVIHGGQQMWSVVSKFIRQCVKDSAPEGLTKEKILKILWDNHNLFAGTNMNWMKENLNDLADAIHAAQEGKGK